MRFKLPAVSGPAWWRLGRFLLLAGFIGVVGRFWHPYYGFTLFLQIDPVMGQAAVPVLHDQPVYFHPDPGAYDGGSYAQIATDPTLRDPALRTAIGDLSYRGRRILLSALAWVAGGGEPVAAARAYAWLNLPAWFGLAWVLWRVFPVGEARGNLAWMLMLVSGGVLFSVRLALTDLPALLLVAGSIVLVERGRSGAGATLLGWAALARETAVLGAAALLPSHRDDWRHPVRLAKLAGLLALVGLPLLLWLAYIRQTVGPSGVGQSNLSWPLAGWSKRWIELAQGLQWLGNPRMWTESVLEHVALTVQVAYLVWRPRTECPWWRVGAAYALLWLCLGDAVWGGFPNATSRVLLPLTLAFNVRWVRDRSRYGWLILGNLSVFAGVHILEAPDGPPHELPAHSTWSSRHMLQTDQRWSVAEWNHKWRWAWCGGDGGLTFNLWPQPATVRLELQVRAITPRILEVRQAGRVVWRDRIGDRPQWITLPELPVTRGRLDLELHSVALPVGEGADNTARTISFACFGARVAE